MQLYDYQVTYLHNLPKNIIMTADVGLGKTIMALEHAKRHGAKRIIVVAPASKVRTGDWQREIEQYFPNNEVTYDVVSYEMFIKRLKIKDYVRDDITLIVDECHFIANAGALRTRAVLKVAKLAHQWIMLSATPLPNGWRSAESYAVLTGLSRTKTEFINRFVIIDRSRGWPLILGYREKPTLEEWWNRVSKPLIRSGNLVLPSQSIATTVAMQPKTAKDYRVAVKDRMYKDEMLDSPSKLFATLRQVPVAERVNALESIIESTDEHVVVFYNFNTERTAILEMLKRSFKTRKVFEQSGHASVLPPRSKWATLKPSVTLAQYQSASQAIELTYASVTVYLSPCTSYANYEQSKGRTRRNGQEKITLFYHVNIDGTIDSRLWHLLKNKQSFSVEMLSKWREIEWDGDGSETDAT